MTPLRVLHLEDDVRDAELVRETLEAGGIECQVTRVETEAAFIAALEAGGHDVILADYTLPSFDGIGALRLVRRTSPLLPFIFVAGTLGEDVAIDALRIGATDYVFKTRLSRMVPAVRRALREAAERTELTRAEQAVRDARMREIESRYAAMMEERARLAREIHDTLLQGFNGVTMLLVAAAHDVGGPPQTVSSLQHVLDLAQKTLGEARRAVWDLRDPMHDGDLLAAIRLEAEANVKGVGLAFELVTEGTPRPMEDRVTDAMLRVVRESIVNVVRHARARRLCVRLSYRAGTVSLSVRDDGVGFAVAPDYQAYREHWGLRGMSERAAEIGAELQVRSRLGAGTVVRLSVRSPTPNGIGKDCPTAEYSGRTWNHIFGSNTTINRRIP